MAKTTRILSEAMDAIDATPGTLDSKVNEASQVAIVVLMAAAALVGVWGVACLIGGIAKSGSLLEMGRGFITAVTGM